MTVVIRSQARDSSILSPVANTSARHAAASDRAKTARLAKQAFGPLGLWLLAAPGPPLRPAGILKRLHVLAHQPKPSVIRMQVCGADRRLC